MRVLVLGGSGLFGSSTARRLAASDLVSEVAVAGRNREALDRTVTQVGEKARAVQVDIRDEGRLASVAADCDMVANAAGPEWEVLVPGLRAAIAAGAHYCDIGADGGTAEAQLALDSAAKERDILAVIGMGLDPGLDNLLALHASRKFDRVEDIELRYIWSLLRMYPEPERRFEELRTTAKHPGAEDLFPYLAGRPARSYRDGRWVDLNPWENPVEVTLPDGMTVTAYPVGMPESITLPRYISGVRNVSSLLGLCPPQLNELLFVEGRRIVDQGVAPTEATKSFLETAFADPDRWLRTPAPPASAWDMSVATTGWKEGRRARYTCWCLRVPVSTTIPLAVATLKILRGEVSARGVLPPEACFEPTPFFEEMASYAKAEDRDKPLLGERFTWLE